MHRNFYSLVLGFVSALLSPLVAPAGVITDSPSNATGITNLTVDSVQYNIVFGAWTQSFNDQYGSSANPNPALALTTHAAADDAVTAIDQALHSDPAIVTVGQSPYGAETFYVPYFLGPYFYNASIGLVAGPGPYGIATYDYVDTTGFSLAVFTPVSTSTPEPASIVLCLSAAGCGVVGAYVRRRWQIASGRFATAVQGAGREVVVDQVFQTLGRLTGRHLHRSHA